MANFDLDKWKEASAKHAAELEAAGFVTPGPRTLKPKDASGGAGESDGSDGSILGLAPLTWAGIGLGVLVVGGFVAYQLARKD